jgi:hypothetical protein
MSHVDNAKFIIAELARVSGLTFARPDRLSRAEAQQALDWAKSNPVASAAYRAGNAEAQTYANWLLMFAHDYPQNDAGEPAEWSDVGVADDPATAEPEPEAEADADNPFVGWTPERAQERIKRAMTEKGFLDALNDPKHEDHALAKREWELIHKAAYPEPAAAPASSVDQALGGVTAREQQTAALKRIDELHRHPGYLNKAHPEHQSVMDELTRSFQTVYPEPASPAGEAGDVTATS